jgi:peptidoglycan-N-acetylglucosamine deacetylase
MSPLRLFRLILPLLVAAFLVNTGSKGIAATAKPLKPIPDKLVVLTFDDSVASHHRVVRPLLKSLGFGATFFISEGFSFRTNKTDYMSWEQIAELHRDGFEIGNHTRDHLAVAPQNVSLLPEQLGAINDRCVQYGIPKTKSFAYPGNGIYTNALPFLHNLGIQFARRGGAPEFPYDEGNGFAYEPGKDHPLLIPSAGDARPKWTLDNLKRAVNQARDGKIAVLQFHGAPDNEHPWVNTPEEKFREYMNFLHQNGFKVIALRELADYVDPSILPADPWMIVNQRRAQLDRPKP